MSVATTSIDAYIEHRQTGKLGCQAMEIFEFMKRHPNRDWSRSELSEAIDIRLSSVCGRVNEMLDAFVLEAGQKRKCQITGKTVNPVKLNKNVP